MSLTKRMIAAGIKGPHPLRDWASPASPARVAIPVGTPAPVPPPVEVGGGLSSAGQPTRPILRYHGGKWMFAPWIIGHFPKHRIYTEAFGGAASVLLRKGRSYSEVYNDLSGDIVNVFRVLRDPASAARLETLLRLTPFARPEFVASYDDAHDPIERARRTIICAFMGFGSASANPGHSTGFRGNANRNGTTPAHDWAHWPDGIEAYTSRLAGVTIEERPGIEIIAAHDTPDTLHYVDPPYLHSSRKRRQKTAYVHEMTDDDHRSLADALRAAKGIVALSGYDSDLYCRLYGDWSRSERKSLADGASPRLEVLWLNPAAIERRERLPLFDGLPPPPDS